MNKQPLKRKFLDSHFPIEEQLPRIFDVTFKEIDADSNPKVIMTTGDRQIGNLLTDNSYVNDGYRFHDVFHFSYVAILGWSPCVRKMLRKKRKSHIKVDEVEDGARAIITEEAISLLVYAYAQENNFFVDNYKVDSILLGTIAKLVSNLEVRKRSLSDWERAIVKGYSAFRDLVKYKGGTIRINMLNQDLTYFRN